MEDNVLVNRPWWMTGIDEPAIGGLLRSNHVPVFGLLRVSAASGAGAASDWILDLSVLETNTKLAF